MFLRLLMELTGCSSFSLVASCIVLSHLPIAHGMGLPCLDAGLSSEVVSINGGCRHVLSLSHFMQSKFLNPGWSSAEPSSCLLRVSPLQEEAASIPKQYTAPRKRPHLVQNLGPPNRHLDHAACSDPRTLPHYVYFSKSPAPILLRLP